MARIVLYDACVLYPAPLRDLLMRLALAGLFQARWTDRIHEEWPRSVLADRPDITAANLARCRGLMDQHVSDSLVTGYEPLIATLTLPDPDDRHVLAAAVHGGAGFIVTFNLRDCPRSPGGATARSQGRQPLDGDPDPNPSPRRPPNPGRRPGLGGRLGESDGRTGTRG